MTWLRNYTKEWAYADFFIASQLLLFSWISRAIPLLVVGLILGIFISRGTFKKDQLSFKKSTIWFFLFFISHLLGVLWSENLSEAWNDIGMKLSLLAIPLALLFVKLNIRRDQLLQLFILGLVVSCVINYSYAIFRSIYNPEDNQWAYFTESYFSFQMHRSYYAVYLVIGVIASIHEFARSRKIGFLFLGLVFGVAVVQTFSKVGILLLLLSAIPVGIYYAYRMIGSLKTSVLLLATIVIAITVYFSSPKMQTRFEKMIGALTSQSNQKETLESNNSRVVMWETSLELISEHPIIGSGTGDVMQVLSDRNIRNGDILLAEKKLNSHNQYLNSWVQLGLLGLLPLIMIFVTGSISAIKNKDLFYVLIVLILGISMFFESSLERQDGVIPITLLVIIFGMIRSPRSV